MYRVYNKNGLRFILKYVFSNKNLFLKVYSMAIKNNFSKHKIKVLIVAAGEGKRAKINYPKTLYKVKKYQLL